MSILSNDFSKTLHPDEIQRVEQFRKSKRTAVLAIMFTDIVGFTEMTEEHGEQASAKLRHLHDEIFTQIITKDGAGEIVKQIGDSFLAVFAEPSTAVVRALEFQDALDKNKDNLTIGKFSLKVRIGIHMGQVSVEDSIQPDIFGRHVNRAARVIELAKGGQVLVTSPVWDSASGWLKENEEKAIESISYGKAKVRGIPDKMEIHEVYESASKPSGLPTQIRKARRNKRLIFAISILLFMGLAIAIVAFLSPKEDNRLFFSNIVSNESDIPNISKMLGAPFNPDKDRLIPLSDSLLNKINEEILPVLFVWYGYRCEIIRYSGIEKNFIEERKTPPKIDITSSDWVLMNHRSFLNDIKLNSGIFLHVYQLESEKNEEQYAILCHAIIRRHNYTINKFATIYSNLNDMIFDIRKELDPIVKPLPTEQWHYPYCKVVSVKNDKVVFSIHKGFYGRIVGYDKPVDYLPIKPGYLLEFYRSFAGHAERIKDLEEMVEYCGTHSDWNDFPDINKRKGRIDSSRRYFWSMWEYYDRLKGRCFLVVPLSIANLKVVPVGMDFSDSPVNLGVYLKVTEVYDSSGVGVIIKKYPWVTLKPDDQYLQLAGSLGWWW